VKENGNEKGKGRIMRSGMGEKGEGVRRESVTDVQMASIHCLLLFLPVSPVVRNAYYVCKHVGKMKFRTKGKSPII
jgi:hypothetical protein